MKDTWINASVVVVILLSAVLSSLQLLRYVPYVGADTQPVFPLNWKGTLLLLVSPWDFHAGRTVPPFRIYLVHFIAELYYKIVGVYAEYVLIVGWLLLGGLGVYVAARLLRVSRFSALTASIAYIVSLLAWHESVHSIYAMLGAYALSPWIFTSLIILLKERLHSLLALLGLALLVINILPPFYAIFTTCFAFPLILAVTITARDKTHATRMLALSMLAIVTFLSPFMLDAWLRLQVFSIEAHGFKPISVIAEQKLSDFMYNYKNNNWPIISWLAWPWAGYVKVIESQLFRTWTGLLIPLTFSIILVVSLPKLSKKIEAIFCLVGYMLTVLLVVVFTLAAKGNYIAFSLAWKTPLKLLTISLAQPIKLGLPATLYSSLIFALIVDRLRKTSSILAVAFLLAMLSPAAAMQLHHPISINNYAGNEYWEAAKLESRFNYSYAFTPYIFINTTGPATIKYYYTFGTALRPLVPLGRRVRECVNVSALERMPVKSLVWKTLYTGFIVSSRNISNVDTPLSPVYVAIPVVIVTKYGTHESIDRVLLKLLEKLYELGVHINSEATRLPITFTMLGTTDTCTEKPDILVVSLSTYCKADALYINDMLLVNHNTIKKIDKLVNNAIRVVEGMRVSYSLIPLAVTIKLPKTYKIYLQLNEFKSPFWKAQGASRVEAPLNPFNIYKVHANTITIYHSMSWLHIMSSIVVITISVLGLIDLAVLVRRCHL